MQLFGTGQTSKGSEERKGEGRRPDYETADAVQFHSGINAPATNAPMAHWHDAQLVGGGAAGPFVECMAPAQPGANMENAALLGGDASNF